MNTVLTPSHSIARRLSLYQRSQHWRVSCVLLVVTLVAALLVAVGRRVQSALQLVVAVAVAVAVAVVVVVVVVVVEAETEAEAVE
jgi:cytochrome c oxidase subunit IV